MTFEQSELQRLVEEIIKALERCKGDPVALDVLLSELRDLYKKVPIYPGVIANLLPGVVRTVDVGEVKEGSEVTLKLKDDRVLAGKVSGVGAEGIKLAGCSGVGAPEARGEVIVPFGDVREVKLLTRGVLRKEWPTLDFEE